MQRSTSLMRNLMLLAPYLATYTVACPHMIPAVAVTSVAHSVRKVMPPIRKAVRPPTSVGVDTIEGPNKLDVPTVVPPSVVKPPELLVRKDDAWRSVSAISSDLTDVELSDARLEQRVTSEGGIEWEVEAPITFAYRIREEADVLDPASDALIFGHLTDEASLARAKARPLKRVVVVDETVFEHYGARIEAYFAHHNVEMRMLVLPTTEENKDMDMVLTIAEAVHDLGIDRRLDPVIAIGGGVCMDIVGFAASIYRRRTPYIRVPTTLMGYVDASIGAKSGVNFYTPSDGWRKNKLGSYMPPKLTLLDKSFLATLPKRQLANGAAEIAKMAIVKDPELFELLVNHGSELIDSNFQEGDEAEHGVASRVLYLAIQTMLEELAPNLWEDSLERLVDFGHVFSMELEMAELFDGEGAVSIDSKLFHGEAVSIDMAFSASLAYVRGHIDEPTFVTTLQMLRDLALPIIHKDFDAEMANLALYERVKFSSGQKIPLPVGRGVARIFNDVTKEQIFEALDEWERRAAVLEEREPVARAHAVLER